MNQESLQGQENYWDDLNQGLLDDPAQKQEPVKEEPEVDDEPKGDDVPPTDDQLKEEPKQEPVEEDYAKVLYEDWKNAGLIKHLEFEDGVDITQESLKELIEADRAEDVKLQMEAYLQGLDPKVQLLLEYAKKGGKIDEFFKRSTSEFKLDGDIKNEKYQNDLIRYYEKTVLGSSDEEIDEVITLLDTGGRKELVASKYQKVLQKKYEDDQRELLRQQEEEYNEALRNEQKFINNINEELKKDTIHGIKLTNKDRADLEPYITQRNVALEGSDIKMTQFQYELQEALRDPSKLIFIAQLIRDNFKLDKLVKNYTTDRTQIFRNRVRKEKGQGGPIGDPWQGVNNLLN